MLARHDAGYAGDNGVTVRKSASFFIISNRRSGLPGMPALLHNQLTSSLGSIAGVNSDPDTIHIQHNSRYK